MNLFSKHKKKYAIVPNKNNLVNEIPDGLVTKCTKCKKILLTKELVSNLHVCPACDTHLQMPACERINQLFDVGSFVEWDEDLCSENPLDFEGYEEKLQSDREKTGLNEAVVTGKGTIEGYYLGVAVMDSRFRMGSMGSVVGEKITRAILKCKEEKIPFVIFTASGGARMQEGILSLMQMAKTSAALKQFSDSGGLYVVVMTHPTTGGVSASFATLGDYNFAEPGALIGFAGRRIIEQTIREELPADFQTAEFLLKCGQLDAVIHRKKMRDTIQQLLKLHGVRRNDE